MPRVLTLKNEVRSHHPHCCEEMTERANFWCDQCTNQCRCAHKDIYYSSVFDEYCIINQLQIDVETIKFCPWCGVKLPKSKREEWFDLMDELGIDINDWGEVGKTLGKYLEFGWWQDR
jgi:hypothetical protein